MSYQALAIRYRPSTFDDLVGQEHVARTLKNALTSDRLHHAYLFTGTRGVGKTSVARILARAINCEKGPTPNPCGVCPACVGIAKGNYPDVIEIDGASNNGVDAARELRDNVRYAPQAGRFRIYIIDEVHMVTVQAFNALLKTLEEPPPHAKFIFATTEIHKVPITILSRCQRFDFKRVGARALAQRLVDIGAQEGFTLSEKGLGLIVRAAKGSVRDAVSLLDQVVAFAGGKGAVHDDAVREALGLAGSDFVEQAAAAVLAQDPRAALIAAASAYAAGQEMRQLLEELLTHWRDLLLVRLAPDDDQLTDWTESERAKARERAAGIAPDTLLRQIHLLMRGVDDTASADDPRLAFEMTLLRMIETAHVQPLGDLLARIEALATTRGPLGAALPGTGGATGGATGGGGMRATSAARPVGAAQPTTSTAQPTTSTAQPTTSTAQPTTSTAQPTTSTAQPTTITRETAPRETAPRAQPTRNESRTASEEGPAPSDEPPPWEDAAPTVRATPQHDAPPPAAPPPTDDDRDVGGDRDDRSDRDEASSRGSTSETLALSDETLAAVRGRRSPAVAELEERFERVVERMMSRHKLLGQNLRGARLMSCEAGRATISFSESFARESFRERTHADAIAQLLGEEFGGPIEVAFEHTAAAALPADAPRAPAQLRGERNEEEKARLRRIALAHPAVVEAIRVFGAKVTDFRPAPTQPVAGGAA